MLLQKYRQNATSPTKNTSVQNIAKKTSPTGVMADRRSRRTRRRPEEFRADRAVCCGETSAALQSPEAVADVSSAQMRKGRVLALPVTAVRPTLAEAVRSARRDIDRVLGLGSAVI